MPGYLTPITESSDRGWLEKVKCLPPDPGSPQNTPINQSIDRVALTWLTAHGWTLGDSRGVIGTKATSILNFLAIPFHAGADGGFSQVPLGAHFMGRYDGQLFELWDSFSDKGGPDGHGDEDPTDSHAGIVGVPIGHSPNETIETFLHKLGGFTNYSGVPVFNMDGDITSATILASGDKGDPNPPYGPLFNDPQWAPDGENTSGFPPRLGGWYLRSTPAPNTGDFVRLWIYENTAGNFTVQFRFRDDDTMDADAYPLAQKNLHFSCNPYQLSAQAVDGETSLSGDSSRTNNFFLMSCLSVPDEFAAGISNAAFFTSDLQNQFQTKTNSAVLVNGVFKKAWTQVTGDVFGIAFPLIDIGTLAVDGDSSALKPIKQAVLVSIAIADSSEGYIAGALWDSYLTIHRYAYEQRVSAPMTPSYIAWIQDTQTLHLTNATLWINATED